MKLDKEGKKRALKAAREEKKELQSIVSKEMLFDKLIKKQRKNSVLVANQSIEGWKKLLIKNNGTAVIRCQAKIKKNGKVLQCGRFAMSGQIACKTHTGGEKIAKKEIRKIKESLGIYSGAGIQTLQKELKEIENLEPEQFQDTTEELKLGIALLRNYLKMNDDEKVAKAPGTLMFLIGEIARLKKEHWEIKHAKNVSFTKEQVMFLFNQFYLILVKLVKDMDLLKDISLEMDKVARLVGKEGFKEIS